MGIEIRAHLRKKQLAEYPVTLVELDKLIPHEMIIEKELLRFISNVQVDGAVRLPMLIDKESYLILDGHHRHAGLLKLGYRTVPAILLDYFNDEIVTVDTWFPLVRQSPKAVVTALKENGFDIQKITTLEHSLKSLKSRKITAIIGNQEEKFQVIGNRPEIFKIVRDQWLDEIRYYDDEKLCIKDAGITNTAIFSWTYTKKEILDWTKKGNKFLPKTTRHTLSYRFKRCDYLLELLV